MQPKRQGDEESARRWTKCGLEDAVEAPLVKKKIVWLGEHKKYHKKRWHKKKK